MISLWPKGIAIETLDVLAATPVEDYGTVVHWDWDNPTTEETIELCSVQAVASPEIVGDREAIVMRVQCWVPGHHPVLDGTKRVRWHRTGQVFQVDGDAPYQPDPFGLGLDHHTFTAKEVQG